MLQTIRMVTLCVQDLDAVERAYVDWLGYHVTERGRIPPGLAATWEAPAAAGSRSICLEAPASPDFTLRCIERPATPGYAALMTHGWNDNEILAEDPERLAAHFAAPHSPFRVIGPPEPLASNPAIVALQALGPAGELCYFTRLPPCGGTFVKTPAKSFVDRSFIVVLGGPEMPAMQAFYRDVLGLAVTPAYGSPVAVLQAAHGLPPEGTTPLALAPLPPGFALELDEYPASATPRPRRGGDLPPGIAMVTFTASPGGAGADSTEQPWWRPPAPRGEAPYEGRLVGMLRGPAQEWIEVILTAAR
jgi:catechol 2,3-dioxygenase-like lactoylglutathione lyase family enzyme